MDVCHPMQLAVRYHNVALHQVVGYSGVTVRHLLLVVIPWPLDHRSSELASLYTCLFGLARTWLLLRGFYLHMRERLRKYLQPVSVALAKTRNTQGC